MGGGGGMRGDGGDETFIINIITILTFCYFSKCETHLNEEWTQQMAPQFTQKKEWPHCVSKWWAHLAINSKAYSFLPLSSLSFHIFPESKPISVSGPLHCVAT
jgi:hypothetical protein